MHTVHVRVNDATTGKPTPCRIRFTDAEGRYYAPFGRLTEFPAGWGEEVGGNVLIGDKKYAYIDGACENHLPAGLLTVEIQKGLEYRPLREQVHLAAGKLALRFTLERWADMRAEGWYSADAWASALTPHAALLEGAGEDLAVVNLLAEQTWHFDPNAELNAGTWRKVIPNILAFSGQTPALERPDCIVVVNTANRAAHLGEVALLNCHRPVFPLTFGDESASNEGGWTVADWCDQCHRKGGLVVASRFGMEELEVDGEAHIHSGEVLADLILGKIDALAVRDLDLIVSDTGMMRAWHAALSAGFRAPLVGGSTKRMHQVVLGNPRTYVALHPGQEFTYKNWIEAIRAGRTFVTNGPLLLFTVDGKSPGATVEWSTGGGPLHIRAEARGIGPANRLEIVYNGVIVAEAESQPPTVVEMDFTLPGPGWLAARAAGPGHEADKDYVGAHTSPIYIHIDGKCLRPNAANAAPLLAWLDKVQRWVEATPKEQIERDRQRRAAVFEAAREELLRRQSG